MSKIFKNFYKKPLTIISSCGIILKCIIMDVWANYAQKSLVTTVRRAVPSGGAMRQISVESSKSEDTQPIVFIATIWHKNG